jgi:hypothetical protein
VERAISDGADEDSGFFASDEGFPSVVVDMANSGSRAAVGFSDSDDDVFSLVDGTNSAAGKDFGFSDSCVGVTPAADNNANSGAGADAGFSDSNFGVVSAVERADGGTGDDLDGVSGASNDEKLLVIDTAETGGGAVRIPCNVFKASRNTSGIGETSRLATDEV